MVWVVHVLGVGQLTDCSVHFWRLAVIPMCRKCVYTILYGTERYSFCVEDACKLQTYGHTYNHAPCGHTNPPNSCKSMYNNICMYSVMCVTFTS